LRRYYVNPPDDPVFAALVLAVGPGCGDPVQLRDALRDRYPDVVVRERGLAGELTELWYVYRDGAWRGARSSEDG
jgi:hypothetical protein